MYRYGNKQIITDTWIIKMNQTTSYTTVSHTDCVVFTASTFQEQPSQLLFN